MPKDNEQRRGETEQERIERYRRMSPTEKLREVEALNRAEDEAERARITAQYGEIPEREMRLRIAAPRLGRELMMEAFGWDPDVEGW